MLDDAVSEGVWTEVQGILENWNAHQIASPLPQTKRSRFREALFSLDTDKAIYLQVATQNLQEFSGQYEPPSALNDQLAKEMKARTEAMVRDLSSSVTTCPVRVLAMIVYQQVSGATYIGLGPLLRTAYGWCYLLVNCGQSPFWIPMTLWLSGNLAGPLIGSATLPR